MGTRDNREIRKIIFDHFDLIVHEWEEMESRKHG